MNEQERWIVYPLLLMLVLMQVKDKVLGSFRSPRVHCQELVIEGPKKEIAASLQMSAAGGSLVLFNNAGKVAAQFAPDEKGAGTMALLSDGKPLLSSETIADKQSGAALGGVLRVHDAEGKVAAAVYANESHAGTVATYLKDKPMAVIDSAQHGPDQNPVGGLFKLYDTAGRVTAAMYTGSDNAGNIATYWEQRPQVVIDSVNQAGRMSVLDRVVDETRAVKVVIAKETNDWGAAFVFGPDGMAHPLAHFTVQRVMPPGTGVSPVDPNTPLVPQKPLPAPPAAAPADAPPAEPSGSAPAESPAAEATPGATANP